MIRALICRSPSRFSPRGSSLLFRSESIYTLVVRENSIQDFRLQYLHPAESQQLQSKSISPFSLLSCTSKDVKTNDLVRLAASVKMVIDSETLTTKVGAGCDAILEGYRQARSVPSSRVNLYGDALWCLHRTCRRT